MLNPALILLVDPRLTLSILLFIMVIQVLESFKIMDYSLLLAAHNVDETKKRRSEERAGLYPPAITEGSRTHQLSPVSEQPSTSDSAGAYDAQGTVQVLFLH